MRLVQQEDGLWVVLYNGGIVGVSGVMNFPTREDAVAQIGARGLVVTDDGEISRATEPVQPQVVEPVEAEPEAAPEIVGDDIPVPDEYVPATLSIATPISDEPVPVDQPIMLETIEEPVDKPKRGRPRTYTPEEAAARRREQNRKYYHARREARKAEVADRSKEWWEKHPDKAKEYREAANEKRRSRYQSDPEYRAKVSAYNREYQARKRAERAAKADTE